MSKAITNRIEWIDVAKGIGIILVVLGHTSSALRYLIYGFHMPLFFFLSGFVFNREKYSPINFCKSRFNSLVIPYVFFYFITYLYWLFVERSLRSFDIEWWRPLLGLIYGSQYKDLMIHNGILWFLPCLFVTQLIVLIIVGGAKRCCTKWLLILLFAVVGISFNENLPWGINIALVASQFYFLAWIIQDKKKIEFGFLMTLGISFFMYSTYVLGMHYFHNSVNMAECAYSNGWLFEIFAYVGIAATVILSTIIGSPFKRTLIWLGKNSLVLFALHQPISRIIRFCVEKSVHVDVQHSLIWSLMVTIAILTILWPIVLLYNKYCKSFLTNFHLSLN